MVMELAATDEATSSPTTSAAVNEEHLDQRCMFLKGLDLLDIDHGHFWYKLSWHGIHVEFPSRLHHYEPDVHERQIRDYFITLPLEQLEAAYHQIQDAPSYTFCHGDHCFTLEWDAEVQNHLHCYYERTEQGRAKDRTAHEALMQRHVEQYEHNRQFPSKRLNAELEHLKAQRARAQEAVEAWDRLILHCEERIAQDAILHKTPLA